MLRKALDGTGFRCEDGAWHPRAEHAGSRFGEPEPFPPWKEAAPADPAPSLVNLHPRRDA
ncbi:MAG: hypothetical protein B7Z62_01890 [Deltaproteobacteria bacterium 37-65-8]|nr:MAG: hypothetical protein B7Z62_01890 [Deltaproteobacteria bacterium 37-65-8]